MLGDGLPVLGGEDVVNRALRRLVKNHAYKPAPYAVSTDLIRYLKEEAGSVNHNLIEDFFEKITLYDIKLNAASVTEPALGGEVSACDEGMGAATAPTTSDAIDPVVAMAVMNPCFINAFKYRDSPHLIT